jgi:hypothetical protein
MTTKDMKRKNRGDARGVRYNLTPEEVSQVQGHQPSNVIQRTEHDGPGTPDEPQHGRPTTTGTPGGGLGAPDEAELKRDPEATSEKDDSRAERDEG